MEQVVHSINDQLNDFKNHRVEVDTERRPPPAPSTDNASNLIVPTILTNGATPTAGLSIPGTPQDRARSVEPKKPISSASSINLKKRARIGPDGSGSIEDEDEDWWERWRKRMKVLDGSGVVTVPTANPIKPKSAPNSKKGKPKSKGKASAHLTNGVKRENGTPSIKIEDEYKRDTIFVDEDEEHEEEDGINEDLRILIKVC